MGKKTRKRSVFNLRALREAKGWSQMELAQEVRARGESMTPQSVSNWERGLGLPNGSMLEILAEVFDTDIPGLFTTEGEE